ncbi:MAG: PAS domain-containing protein [Rhodospirillales bacterium]|nr:PAS domain-containing protein [Rhodospirillales bacterium]
MATHSVKIRSDFSLLLDLRIWLLPGALSVLLCFVSFQNYLLFHITAELFAVMVAILLCVVAWQTFPFSKNSFLMYLGCGYFWVAVLDSAHMLVYKGMSVFPIIVANPATQFWIASRFSEALLLLTAPFFLDRAVVRVRTFCVFGIIATVIGGLIASGNFPDAFIEGQGLTPFKVTSEYVIIAILVVAVAVLVRRRELMEPRTFALLIVSILLTMVAELAFTFYVSVYGLSNMVGHIFKFISFCLIFQAVIRQSLHDPYVEQEQRVVERTRELRDKSFILNAIIEGTNDAVFVKDTDGRFIHVNRMTARYFASEPEDIVGKSDEELFPPEIAAETLARDRLVMETGEVCDVEEVVHFQGEERAVQTYKTPYRDGNGGIIGVIGIARDISDRKRHQELLEARLRLSELSATKTIEELIQAFLDEAEKITGSKIGFFHFLDDDENTIKLGTWSTNTLDAMCSADDFQMHYPISDAGVWADAAHERRPVIHNDYVGLDHKKGMPEGHAPVFRELVVPVIRGGKTKVILGVGNKKSDYEQADVKAVSELADLAWDIVERKNAETSLRESEERSSKAFKLSPVPSGIARIDDGCHFDVNDQWVLVMGYSREEAIGRTVEDLGIWDDITQRAVLVDRLRRDGVVHDFDAVFVTKHGEKKSMVLDGHIIEINGKQRLLLAFRDVTAHNQMERQLLQAQKMETVGQLTGGVAHDFNNLLQVIQGNLELAKNSIAGGSRAEELVDRALVAGHRGAKLTQQLLAFSRKQTLRPERLDACSLVEGMSTLLARTLGEDISIETTFADGPANVIVDENGLTNALLNLALNARAAMPKGGTLTVAVGARHIDKDIPVENDVLASGDYVEISVTDTGSGMSRHALEHAFEPFFTTKEIGEGSGLGLSMVYGFARQSGGNATIESELGQGATVRLVLPAATGEAALANGVQAAGRNLRHAIKVLLVEDDADVRDSTVMVLTSFGCQVIEADNAAPVAGILEKDDGIELLISDIVLPGEKNGVELAQEAVRLRPGLKVILVSGYPEGTLEKSGLSDTEFLLLSKPFSKEALSEAMVTVMARNHIDGSGVNGSTTP